MDGLRLSAVIMVAGSASSALAQYQAVPLGGLGGAHGASVACVNNNGEAVGVAETSTGALHAFYWANGTMEDMGTLQGGASSHALWINNGGAAVGTSKNSAGQDRAVIWQRSRVGGWHCDDLGTLGGAYAWANKISDTGYIVGYSARTSGSAHAFRYLSGTMNDLGALNYPATTGYSEAVGVNNAGQVVGFAYAPLWGPDHAWHYNTSQVDITPPGQFTFARGMAINNTGMAAGITILSGGQSTGFEAATWTQAGGWHEIGVVPTLTESEAYATNDAGDVVGRSFDAATGDYRGFVYKSGQIVDLVSFAPTHTPIVEAMGINSSGWIAANATADFDTIEAYILKPACYANCDASTIAPVLNVSDFSCFLNRFASGDSYANCDNSTTPPVLNIGDFSCFLNSFASGCP